MSHLPRGLYVITDSKLLAGHLLPAVAAALEGGAAVVQYRHKSLQGSNRHWYEAEQLLALCQQYKTPLIINDDVELAAAIGADGVHLGRGDGSIATARQRLGTAAIIGATCHDSLHYANESANQGASYLAFGAMYPSSTKPGTPQAPISCLSKAERFRLPVVAIGGITADNAAPLIAAGAHCVAVISDLWSAPDITARAREFSLLFG
ncbi:MAG: thiamine phosphate synthase [Moraxellaceae bacterium]